MTQDSAQQRSDTDGALPRGDAPSKEGCFHAHRQMVGMMLSWRCQARCRHCAYDCDPRQGRVMTIDEMIGLVDAARAVPWVDSFSLVGGEPFLHHTLLKQVCRHIKETCGYPFTISTNGSWAVTRTKAIEVLSELRDLGLRVLLVSVDDFHLEYVDPRRIEICASAALEVGLECYLQAIVTRSSRRVSDFKRMLSLPHDHPGLKWTESPCIPTGRAEDPALAPELELEWRNRPGTCSVLKVWMVDPQGNVSPCCGVPLSRFLQLGNAFEESLTHIVHRANVDPLLNALAAYGGPYLLIELLAARGNRTYQESTFTSNCHACQAVLKDGVAIRSILDELQEHRLELLAGRAIQHEQVYGQSKNEHTSLWLPEPWRGGGSELSARDE